MAQQSGKERVKVLLELIGKAAYQALDEYEKAGEDLPTLQSTTPHPLDAISDNIALKKAIRLLEGSCDQLVTSLAPPYHIVVNRVEDYSTFCTRIAGDAGIADILVNHPDGLHTDKLSEMTKIESKKLGRILRTLATRNIFREVEFNVFANNRLSMMLVSEHPIGDFARLCGNEASRAGVAFYDSLLDPEYGPSFDPAKSPFIYTIKDKYTGHFYEYLTPERRKVFGRSMIGINTVMGTNAVLRLYPWKDVKTVTDVGSGVGSFSLPLSQAFPHIKLSLMDLPQLIEQAEEAFKKDNPQAIEQQRVNFLPSDFFKDIPEKGQDVYYLRKIVHNWPDAEVKKILQRVREAMRPNSRLLIHELILRTVHDRTQGSIGLDTAPEPLLPNFGYGNMRMYNQDMVMLLMYNAGDRTYDDMITLCSPGLELVKVWDLGETTVLEYRLASS